MSELLRRYGITLTITFMVLTAVWLLVLVILPYIYLFEASFRLYLPMDEVGGPNDIYTLQNYTTFFVTPIHRWVFGLTIFYSSVVTVIAFFIAYPLAYYLSKVASGKMLPTLFLLLMIPMWVSEILRSFAWFIILSLKGPLNYALIGLGLYLCPIHAFPALQRYSIARYEPD